MPLIAPKDMSKVNPAANWGGKMQPEKELMVICGLGKCHQRLDRVLKKRPDVNYKDHEGMTPLHIASKLGSGKFVDKLLKAKADPNIVGGAELLTPLEVCNQKIDYEEDRDSRLNDFEQVGKLDTSALAVRPDIAGHYEVRRLLLAAGGVEAKVFSKSPNVTEDGAVNGKAPSALRRYNKDMDGTYSLAERLRTGEYDVVDYDKATGLLVQGTFTGKVEERSAKTVVLY